MRKAFVKAVIVLGLVLINSCDKNDSSPSPGIGGSMSGSIDGTAWAATSVTFYQPSSNEVQFAGQRDPTGNNPTAIGIDLKAFTGVAVYNVLDTMNQGYLIQDAILYKADTGYISVNQNDSTWFKASFNFRGVNGGNTKSVSGSFTYRKK
jgi:hypothetical protein